MYDQILDVVNQSEGHKCKYGVKFKYWCKTNFKSENIGARRLLFCKKTPCPVATMEETFATNQCCHQRVGHSGRDKIFDEVKRNYSKET